MGHYHPGLDLRRVRDGVSARHCGRVRPRHHAAGHGRAEAAGGGQASAWWVAGHHLRTQSDTAFDICKEEYVPDLIDLSIPIKDGEGRLGLENRFATPYSFENCGWQGT